MKRGEILFLLTVFFLSCHSVFAQTNNSSITIRIDDGRYVLSGVIDDESTRNDVINAARSALGNDLDFSRLNIDSKAKPFDNNWRQKFEQTLARLKNWKKGLVIFTDAKNEADNYSLVDPNILNEEILLIGDQKIRLADFKDKRILLAFIAEWAAPARTTVLDLNKIFDEYSSRGFEIIGIGVDDAKPDKATFRKFVKAFGIQFKTGWASKSFMNYFSRVAQMNGIPMVFAIYDGKFRSIFSGGGPKVSEAMRRFVKEFAESEFRK